MRIIIHIVAILILIGNPLVVPYFLQNSVIPVVHAQDGGDGVSGAGNDNTSYDSGPANSDNGDNSSDTETDTGAGSDSETSTTDGQSFDQQSPETQEAFTAAAEGTGLTPQEMWAAEHNQELETGKTADGRDIVDGKPVDNPDQSGISSGDMAAIAQGAVEASARQGEISRELSGVRSEIAGLEVGSARWTELVNYEGALREQLAGLTSQIISYAEAQKTYAAQQQAAMTEQQRNAESADKLQIDLRQDLGESLSADKLQSLLTERPELLGVYSAYAGLPGNVLGQVIGGIISANETDPGKIGAAVSGFLTSLGVTEQSTKEAAAMFAYNTALGANATAEGRAAAATAAAATSPSSPDDEGKAQVSAHLTASRADGLTAGEIETGVGIAVAENVKGYDFGVSLGRVGGGLNAYGENLSDKDARDAMKESIMNAAINAGMSPEEAKSFANQAMLGYSDGKGASRGDLGVPAPPDPPTSGAPAPAPAAVAPAAPAAPSTPGTENGTLSLGSMNISIPAGSYSRTVDSPVSLSLPAVSAGSSVSSQEMKFDIPNGGGTFTVSIQAYQGANPGLETATVSIGVTPPGGTTQAHSMTAPAGTTVQQINDTFSNITSPSDFASKATNAGWTYKQ